MENETEEQENRRDKIRLSCWILSLGLQGFRNVLELFDPLFLHMPSFGPKIQNKLLTCDLQCLVLVLTRNSLV